MSMLTKMRCFGFAHLVIICLLAITPVAQSFGAVQTSGAVRIIALTGDPAPDGNGVLRSFGAPTINSLGEVAYSATLSDTQLGSDDDLGVFLAKNGTTLQILRENQPVPDGNGRISTFINLPAAINDLGQAAVWARLRNTHAGDLDNHAIYRGDGTALTQVVRLGQLSPDGNGRFSSVGNLSLNSVGEVAFSGGFTGTAEGFRDRAGIFRSDGSTLTQIARTGDVASGGTSWLWALNNPILNDAGQVVFHATLSGSQSSEYGIFRGDGMTLVQIARTGQTIPDGSRQFLRFSSFNLGMNNSGEVVFVGRFHDTLSDGNEGIYRGDGTMLTEIARTGQPAPDGNGRFAAFSAASRLDYRGHLLNEAGQVAFRARMSDTVGGSSDTDGIFLGDGTTLTQIARSGQAVSDGNGVFGQLRFPVLNNAGQVAFLAPLEATIGGSNDNSGIYFYDPVAGLLQVARRGDPLLGSFITGLGLTTSFDPAYDKQKGINDLGQLAFSFVLADGRRGIAVWTIPEPTSMVLLTAGAGLMALFGRRRG